MQEIEPAQTMEEAIRTAVETARKAYEAPPETMSVTDSDGQNPAARNPTAIAIPPGYDTDRRERPDEPALEAVGAKSFTFRHEQHVAPERRMHDGGYRTAVRKLANEPDHLYSGPGHPSDWEGSAPGGAEAARAIPARQEDPVESQRLLCTAIEQLRQDMNRNHSEAAHFATRKDHTRP